jgi:hypothetical protein
VLKSAEAVGKEARVVDTDDEEGEEVFGATWVLVTNGSAIFQAPELGVVSRIVPNPKLRLWTDSYSNLFQILR